ncbi:hypothetical protein KKC45_01500 [Patescibacteria group bacterium]|nr:hypothetical protein [Patescibacteria group bacterium]
MNLVTVITLYRNKFQKPTLFFSNNNFSIGSIIFVPFPKIEKPAIVIDIDSLENKKAFIRRNKIGVNQMVNETELPLFKKETIDITKKAEEKTKYSFEEIFQKILTKKTVQEINKIKPNSDLKNIKKTTDKLSLDLIRNKLRESQPTKKTESLERGIKTIGSVLQIKKPEKTSLHTEKHYLVNEIRNYFGETAKKGKGSFGFYLGFFSRVPKATIYQYWAEIKESRKPIKEQQKIFWWKMGQYSKTKK